MNRKSFILLPYILLLLLSVIAGTLLMAFVYYLPVDPEKKANAEETLWNQNTTADYPNLTYGEQYYDSYRPGVFDGGTANGVITYYAYKESGARKWADGMIPDYARYWHGYLVLLRPLLYFVEYKDLEILNSFLLLLFALILCGEISRRKGLPYVLLFATSFLLLMPMVAGLCLQYIPVILITYSGMLFMIRKQDFLQARSRFFLFTMLLGILTSFFDLLTFPLYTWGIPVLWWILLDERDAIEKKEKEYVLRVIGSAISWFCGYLGMWAGKWIVGSLLLQQNVLADAITSLFTRGGSGYSLHDRYYSIYKNWRHYSYTGYAIILLVWLVVWLYHSFRSGLRQSTKRYALGLIFLSSSVWYAFSAQHADIHHYFTYRTFGVMIAAALALMLESMYGTGQNVPAGRNGRLQLLLVSGICCAAAFACVTVSCEETEVSNKTIPCWQDDYFVDQVQMEMDYTPARKRILGICIAMYTENREGFYSLQLCDQDRILYEENIPVSFMGDFNYVLYPVDWQVQKGKTYRLKVQSVGMEQPIQLYLSDYDMADYPEIGPVTLNGQALDAKSCFGAIYWAPPFSRSRAAFLWGTWFTAFLLALYVLCPDHSKRRSAAS